MYLEQIKSKLDSDYLNLKNMLDSYQNEVELCQRYCKPEQSAQICNQYSNQFDQLDNRFIAQLKQYQQNILGCQPKMPIKNCCQNDGSLCLGSK